MTNEKHHFRINLTELTTFSLIILGPRRLFGGSTQNLLFSQMQRLFKVTRPSFFGGVPSYFEAVWYPHLYFYRKSNT